MKRATAPAKLRREPLRGPADERWRERAGRLFAEFERPAHALVRRAFRGAFSADEIDDIYSGAWVGTLRALADREAGLSDEEVRSYVLTAVANQAGKELRRRRRKPTAPLELVGPVPDLAETPEELAGGAEESRVTRDLLASLPPRRRAVLLLRYGWGLEPAQVCALIEGLSPRAYRREITRGVEQLTRRMRALERGEWCADREPLLRALVAGVADGDQERQARAHLAHCRPCSEFVARLSDHLHDIGGALAASGAIDRLQAHLPFADRLAELGDRGREVAAGALVRAPAGAENAAGPIGAADAGRGAGAVGTGVLAKLAGLGGAGQACGRLPGRGRGRHRLRRRRDRPARDRERGREARPGTTGGRPRRSGRGRDAADPERPAGARRSRRAGRRRARPEPGDAPGGRGSRAGEAGVGGPGARGSECPRRRSGVRRPGSGLALDSGPHHLRGFGRVGRVRWRRLGGPAGVRAVTRRGWIALVATLAASAAAAPAAHGAGATYTVLKCHVNSRSASEAVAEVRGPYSTANRCSGVDQRLEVTNYGFATSSQTAYWRFNAPAGTAIVGLKVRANLRRDNHHLAQIVVLNSAGTPRVLANGLDTGQGFQDHLFTGLNDAALVLHLVCNDVGGCPSSEQAHAYAQNIELVLSDRSDPQVTSVSGSLVGGGWLRGEQRLAAQASDSGSGLRNPALRRSMAATSAGCLAVCTAGSVAFTRALSFRA